MDVSRKTHFASSSSGRSPRAAMPWCRAERPAKRRRSPRKSIGGSIEIAVEVARGRVPVIAGCGSNNTAHAIELTRNAKEVGADAALHVPPYYNRPNQDGIYFPSGGRRRPRYPDHPLQCAVADDYRHRRRDHGAPVAFAERDRGQGRYRQSGSRFAPSGSPAASSSSSFPATTTWRSASMPWAARAASRSVPTSRRSSARSSRRRCAKAAGTKPSSFRTGSIRCTPRCSPTLRPARSNMRCHESARVSRTISGLPMTEPSAASKQAVDSALEHAGLI